MIIFHNGHLIQETTIRVDGITPHPQVQFHQLLQSLVGPNSVSLRPALLLQLFLFLLNNLFQGRGCFTYRCFTQSFGIVVRILQRYHHIVLFFFVIRVLELIFFLHVVSVVIVIIVVFVFVIFFVRHDIQFD